MTGAPNQIRALNDAFRTAGPSTGGWLITSGVQALGARSIFQILELVIGFAAFGPDIDPRGEHDFGRFELAGEVIYWKIDYYDLDLEFGSPDPTDPDITKRVLTILLASEY